MRRSTSLYAEKGASYLLADLLEVIPFFVGVVEEFSVLSCWGEWVRGVEGWGYGRGGVVVRFSTRNYIRSTGGRLYEGRGPYYG